jgi:hypothetical protein
LQSPEDRVFYLVDARRNGTRLFKQRIDPLNADLQSRALVSSAGGELASCRATKVGNHARA